VRELGPFYPFFSIYARSVNKKRRKLEEMSLYLVIPVSSYIPLPVLALSLWPLLSASSRLFCQLVVVLLSRLWKNTRAPNLGDEVTFLSQERNRCPRSGLFWLLRKESHKT
jgi:hypothetical protein